jgi:hypothetical protein
MNAQLTPLVLAQAQGPALAFGGHADRLCRQLAKSLSMRSGRPVWECANQVGQSISLALAKGWGERMAASFRS